MQHVQPPRPAPRRSAPAPSAKLVFGWEPFPKLVPELKKLWPMHWREIALDQDTVPLDPDWECYFALDEIGILAICTARYNGHLAGYIFNHVGPHNHYCSTKFAHAEMFFLHPRFRKGWQPVKMFLENIRGLQAREVKIHTINFKLTYKDGRVGKLFQRLGYVPTDIVMRKVL
jgi:hypothetical protein